MFITKLQEVRKEALAYIESVIAIRGTDYELCPPQEDEEEAWEEIFEMPCHHHRDKHNLVTLYYIYAITQSSEGELLFNGYDPEASAESDMAFYAHELETATMCYMADLIYSLETQPANEGV